MDKFKVIQEIKPFLEGRGDLKYLVNVEATRFRNVADCVIHEPGKKPQILQLPYEPFLYIKNFKKHGLSLYDDDVEKKKDALEKYGITITPLKTGNQKRLVDGYCFKVTTTQSFNSMVKFFQEGGVSPFEKVYDDDGEPINDFRGFTQMKYRDLFYWVKDHEQFLISNGYRFYKGFEDYNDIHKLTFDIETTGLRYQSSRIFSIGVKDNKGFETTLEVEKMDDDVSEINIIKEFFKVVTEIRPAILCGYNSESFDFDFILGRMGKLNMQLTDIQSTLKRETPLTRQSNSRVKIGNTSEIYTATKIWGISVIDIIFAAKRTVAINSEMNNSKLKYVAAFEKIAKENRTHINGEENRISQYYKENKIFVINELNDYIQIPDKFQNVGRELFNSQQIKDDDYKEKRNALLKNNKEFVTWFREKALPNKMDRFTNGRQIVKQYLLDDLWETEQVDGLYNQSSFMLVKMIPTTYERICTMGTGGIWNLILTAWSYENDLAVPYPDENEKFSGGLARCYKKGYAEDVIKIDYASLYPMEQLTWDIFPIFDITGVFKKLILYFTTTRNIYKKMGGGDELNNEEISLLKEIDKESYSKFESNQITKKDKGKFKVKQLPIKILNNSNFGALGSGPSFNWSDNRCAARITCTSRLDLRKVISYFKDFGCIPLLAVTDGINFSIPKFTKIKFTNEGTNEGMDEGIIDEMWQYNGKNGIRALIEKFNTEAFKGDYMSVDNDGEFVAALNLSRINYALLSIEKDKETGEVKEKLKRTGNTIKSKTMPEYAEEFYINGLNMLLRGKGVEFVDYYNDYVEKIYKKEIPLKKIASKSKVKMTTNNYFNRGVDKNGRLKGKQAYMELIIEQRSKIAHKLFEEYRERNNLDDAEVLKMSETEKFKLITDYMPPEPELDSYVYYVNTGYRKSHGDTKLLKDKITGEWRIACSLIKKSDLEENPDMTGDYNVEKYLDAFNKKVKSILIGFDPEIRGRILAKIVRKKEKDESGKSVEDEKLVINEFLPGELTLKNYDSDSFDESMYIEDRELLFWSKTGFDPRLVWDGFKTHENKEIYYEIYDTALSHVNEKMKESGSGKIIKSVNDDNFKRGDLVLLKNHDEYDIALFNGTFFEVKKSNIEIPFSDDLKQKQEKIIELENRIKKKQLKVPEHEEEEVWEARRLEYFEEFKKDRKITLNIPMDDLFDMVENLEDAFDDYVNQIENAEKREIASYLGVDYDD